MKIELNIEKKHLIVFGAFLLLIAGGYVFAQNNPEVFHEYLYADYILSHSGDVIKVQDNLILDGSDSVNAPNLEWRTNTANTGEGLYFGIDQQGSDSSNPKLGFYQKTGGDLHWLMVLDKDGNLCDGHESDANCKKVSEIVGGVSDQLPPLVMSDDDGHYYENLATDIGYQNVLDYCADGDGCFYRLIHTNHIGGGYEYGRIFYGSIFVKVHQSPSLFGTWWSFRPGIPPESGLLGNGGLGEAIAQGYLDNNDEPPCQILEGDGTTANDNYISDSPIGGSMSFRSRRQNDKCTLIIYD